MASLSEEARSLLKNDQPLTALEKYSSRKLIQALTMLINDSDDHVRQRACWELGELISQMNPPRIEDFIRRLMWRLNPESGDNPFGVPEALGEIGYRAPQAIESFVPAIMQYLEDEKLRPGILQAAGRIGHGLPNVLSAYADHISSFLRDTNAVVSANAALALCRIGGDSAGNALGLIKNDTREITLFCGKYLLTMELSELPSLSREQIDGFCYIKNQE